MINKFFRLVFVIVIVGSPFVQYTSADGETVYNGIPPVVFMADPNPSRPPLHIKAAVDLLTLPPESATATFSINYVPAGGTDLFGDSCSSFPGGAQAALNTAASIWANIIQSSVPITIEACWASNLPAGVLGQSGGGPWHSDRPNFPLANTFYPGALANALEGYDIDPSHVDMHITFNLNFSWYTGTDGNPGTGQFDLVSVALHEMGHGLGFSGSMRYSGGQGSWGYKVSGIDYPFVYDAYATDGSDRLLIDTANYPNPSTVLGAALTSDSIYFHGSNAMAANGGQRVKIYAPSIWNGGSSYSHLDYNTFNNTPNQLMVWAIAAGEVIHDPGPVAIGMLTDLGWVTSASICVAENVFVSPYDSTCSTHSPCYFLIQYAVSGASPCTAINTTGDTYEDVVIDKDLILQGGWNSTFTTIQSNTTIRSLNITTGTLTVGNIILGP